MHVVGRLPCQSAEMRCRWRCQVARATPKIGADARDARPAIEIAISLEKCGDRGAFLQIESSAKTKRVGGAVSCVWLLLVTVRFSLHQAFAIAIGLVHRLVDVVYSCTTSHHS